MTTDISVISYLSRHPNQIFRFLSLRGLRDLCGRIWLQLKIYFPHSCRCLHDLSSSEAVAFGPYLCLYYIGVLRFLYWITASLYEVEIFPLKPNEDTARPQFLSFCICALISRGAFYVCVRAREGMT